MSAKIEVKKDVLEAMLTTAREGEMQVVVFSKDNHTMAMRAAQLSKRKCGQMVEVLQMILSGKEVSMIPSEHEFDNDDDED